MTINELLSLVRVVRSRVSELQRLRDSVSTTERWVAFGEKEKEKTPNYCIKDVDKKIAELEIFLFKADSTIKQSNAVTRIDIDANIEGLLAPLS